MRRLSVKITPQDIPGFLFLFIIIGLEIQTSLQKHCQSVQPEAETDYALIGTEYASLQTGHHALCLLECEKSELCMSLNYYKRTSTCFLNTQTKDSRPERYEPRDGCIYFKNPSGRVPAKVKGMRALPAKSCLDVLVSGGSIGTGVYWLDPKNKGDPIKAYCDMDTDGGGWTIVKMTVLQTSSPGFDLEDHKTYHVIKEYDRNDVSILPKVQAMANIIQLLGFHQIHFYCFKKSVGRKVSIMTKNNTAGQQVVLFFTESDFGFPNACGSFDRLPEDTSILAQNCEKWGKNASDTILVDIDKWGSWQTRGNRRLVTRPFAMEGSDKHAFGLYHTPGFTFLCDDNENAVSPYNPGDIMEISVR